MNHILLIINVIWSVLLVVVFSYSVYALFRVLKRQHTAYKFYSNPESLTHILQCMIHEVGKEGDWTRLEVMRDDVRSSLRILDNLRHDVSNKPLRGSKPSRAKKVSN